jgi:hypothetical protein
MASFPGDCEAGANMALAVIIVGRLFQIPFISGLLGGSGAMNAEIWIQ